MKESEADVLVSELKFGKDGLIPAIIREMKTKEVLTLCYMNEEALRKTIEAGKVHVWRRSKGRLMMKGETSACVQMVREILVDCENNSLLIEVEQVGVACHTGEKTCFYRKLRK